MLRVSRIWGIGVVVCLLPARMAYAQEPSAPPARPATAAAPTAPVTVNHADNVIVAESGSQVTVHPKEGDDFAPDPARKAALIASSIFFGLGISVTGIGYLVAKGEQNCS